MQIGLYGAIGIVLVAGAVTLSGNVLFAQYLRGPAAVLVVLSHAFGVFWLATDVVAKLIGVSRLDDISFAYSMSKTLANATGQLGVAVFFLLSGFVISLSISSGTTRNFMTRRIIRIYPVYFACFGITVGSIWLTGFLFDGSFPYTAGEILIHAFILPREWLNSRLIDGVSWTLEIEMTFYIFMAVLGSAMLRSGVWAVAVASAIFGTIGIALTFLQGWDWIARQFGTMPMLFSGCAFYLLYRGRASILTTGAIAVVGIAFPAVVMAISARFSAIWPGWIAGYLVGTVLFSLAYFFRDRIQTSRILNHLSEISYPLYASHIFLSYTIMYSMLRAGYPVWLSFFVMFLSCYVVALAIHLAVERPSLRLIRTLKQRI